MNDTFCYKLGYKNGFIFGEDDALHNAKYNCVITRFINVKCNSCYTIGFSEGYYEAFMQHQKEENPQNQQINYWQEYEQTKYLLNLKHYEDCETQDNRIQKSLINESSDSGACPTEWNDSGYFDYNNTNKNLYI